MKISTNLRDVDRFYLNNLKISGQGELPDKNGNISNTATHKFLSDKGFIIGAVKVIKKSLDKINKK